MTSTLHRCQQRIFKKNTNYLDAVRINISLDIFSEIFKQISYFFNELCKKTKVDVFFWTQCIYVTDSRPENCSRSVVWSLKIATLRDPLVQSTITTSKCSEPTLHYVGLSAYVRHNLGLSRSLSLEWQNFGDEHIPNRHFVADVVPITRMLM